MKASMGIRWCQSVLNRLMLVLIFSVFCTQASAGIITDTAQFAGQSLVPQTGPSINFVELVSAGYGSGRFFTNQNGESQGSGNRVRTVGATLLSSAESSVVNSTLMALGPDNGQYYVVLFGIEGTVGDDGISVAYDRGGVQVVEAVAGSFDSKSPKTWQFSTAVVAAQYSIAVPNQISPGGQFGGAGGLTAVPMQITHAATDVNVSGLNISLSSRSSGSFLFRESSPYNQLFNTDSGQFAPTGTSFSDEEYLIVETRQGVIVQTENSVGGELDATDLIELNSIAQFAFGDEFASALGPGASDDRFNVNFDGLELAPVSQTGIDFISDFGFSAIPARMAVPEPGTLALCLIGVFCSLLGRGRRRCHGR